ncbi:MULTISPECIES: hypothetical protein [unclassified Mesorhizobium]|uniref:hypothetical protein n=1 Tax=unclassified Mesorhizobium TaxID=325217 RepID=UPI0013DEC938|nr:MULTISPECIES: hypothetical protein [unclassified Mesorhizobium]
MQPHIQFGYTDSWGVFQQHQLAGAMAGQSFEEWTQQLGLQRIDDPHFDKSAYRAF